MSAGALPKIRNDGRAPNRNGAKAIKATVSGRWAVPGMFVFAAGIGRLGDMSDVVVLDAIRFRSGAGRCRRLALALGDRRAVLALTAIADECDVLAGRLEVKRPSA